MRHKVLRVSLNSILEAVARDDRKRDAVRSKMGLSSGPQPFITCDGIPDDAKVVSAQVVFETNELWMKVESETFPDTPDGHNLPWLIATIHGYTSKQIYEEESQAKNPATIVASKKLGTLDDSTGSFLGYPVVVKEGEKPVLTDIQLGDMDQYKNAPLSAGNGKIATFATMKMDGDRIVSITPDDPPKRMGREFI